MTIEIHNYWYRPAINLPSPPVLTEAIRALTCDPGDPEAPGMSEEQTQA